MRFIFVALVAVALCFGFTNVMAAEKAFGEALTMEEATSISAVNANPADFADKDMLISGKVVDMCRHRGCWVMIETTDKAQILCRSLDESIQFPVSALEMSIRLEGKLMYDKDAPGTELKSHDGEEPHACPNPQVMVSISGALVDIVEAAPDAESSAE
jgi:hypothetical protein